MSLVRYHLGRVGSNQASISLIIFYIHIDKIIISKINLCSKYCLKMHTLEKPRGKRRVCTKFDQLVRKKANFQNKYKRLKIILFQAHINKVLLIIICKNLKLAAYIGLESSLVFLRSFRTNRCISSSRFFSTAAASTSTQRECNISITPALRTMQDFSKQSWENYQRLQISVLFLKNKLKLKFVLQ